MSYIGDVNTGSSIQFVSSTLGWRLDGQDGAPHLDRSLADGPNASYVWPGSAISTTTDGGKTWTRQLSESSGIWGLDFVNGQVGWAVGVTELLQTVDGGMSWHSEPEPAAQHLASIHFVSAAVGFGITDDGGLVRTGNGGQTWQPIFSGQQVNDFCFASPGTGWLSTWTGAVYATVDGGTTWTATRAGALVEPGQQAWSVMACSAQDAWQSVTTPEVQDPSNSPTLLRHGSTTAASWALAGTAYPDPLPGQPGVILPVGSVSAMSEAGDGSLVLAGYPVNALGLDIYTWPQGGTQTLSASSTPRPATPDGTPGSAGASSAYLPAEGITFQGASGWMMFDDTAVNSGTQGTFQEIVWQTEDYGRSWSVVNSGPVTPFPGVTS